MQSILQDLRFGLRQLLLRDRAFSLTVLLTLAVCIGANVAIYSVVHSVVLRPLPFAQPERLVTMYNLYPGLGVGREAAANSAADFFFRRARVDGLEEVALFDGGAVTIGGPEGAERVPDLAVTPSFFPMLGVRPALGRTFLEEEMVTDGEVPVILTHAFWRERFGGSPDALGQRLRVQGLEATIVGVLPADFRMPTHPDTRVVIPLRFTPQQQTVTGLHNNNFGMLARLAPGATIEQVQAQLDALNEGLLAELGHPQWLENAGFHTVVMDARADLVRNARPVLFLLWGSVAFVLLIGCVNIANLMLARAQVRLRELATRMALGAGRARLARQILTEALIIGTVGAAAGVLIGALGLRLLSGVGIGDLPRGAEVALDGPVLVFAVLLALAVSVAIGALPVLHLFRTDLQGIFRAEGRAGTGGRRATLLRSVLVAGQVGLAFLLLAGAGLMLRSFQAALEVDPGFAPHGVLTAHLNLPQARYDGADATLRFAEELLAGVRALPGVVSAGVTSHVPFAGRRADNVIWPVGYEPGPGESLVSPQYAAVSPGYFEAMGIRVMEGRAFEERDGPGAPLVMVIDRTLAERYWPGRSPLGQRMGAGETFFTIVGVVEPIKHHDLTDEAHVGAYYRPYAQSPWGTFGVVARTAIEPAALSGSMQGIVSRLDPEIPLFDVQTMESRLSASLGTRRTPMILLNLMAGVALFLALLGIYGILAYSVAQRTREIGIRIAVGGPPASILALVLRQGLVVTAFGLAAGGLAAVGLVRLIQSLLFGVQPGDPLVLLGTGILLAAAAFSACLIPARRATRIDPMRALAEG